MNATFSIIMPLYNKAPYVNKALSSVCAQTYKSFELIVLDDGSTDDSAAIAEQYLKKTNSIDWKIIHQHNSGVSIARNNGVAKSKGDYIVFLDADDWWHKDFLLTMVEAISHCPDAGIYGVNYSMVRKGKCSQGVPHLSTGIIDYFKAYYRPPYVMPLWTGSVAIPKAVFKAVGGFSETIWMAEDFDLWVRIALSYPVYYTDKVLAYYNQDVQVRWRAIGKLVDPIHHFVFHSDYLRPVMDKNEDVKHVIDMVRIVCLKQYYLSHEYHKMAEEELLKIPVAYYQDKSFAAYFWKPIWLERIRMNINHAIKFLRNG